MKRFGGWVLIGLLAWGVFNLRNISRPDGGIAALTLEQQNLKEFEAICASYIQDMLGLAPKKRAMSVIKTGKLSTGYTLEAYIDTGSEKRWFACEDNRDANRIVTTVRNE